MTTLDEELFESLDPDLFRLSPPRHRRRRSRGRMATVIGAVLILAVVGFQLYATAWNTHSTRVGKALVKAERAQAHVATAASGSSASCVAAPPAPDAAVGVLDIPSIGLEAPVLQGSDDAQLSVAVGHLQSSVWPGAAGTAVMLAHDVSYFVNINQLKPGDVIRFSTLCQTYTYDVTGQQVVTQGSPVNNTPTPSMVLVTCWPTDALWFTSQRLLVTAAEASVTQTGTAPTSTTPSSGTAVPNVPAPAELVSQGLTLATNSVPMGAMTIAGTPDTDWVQSPGPLNVESAAVEAYIGGIRAADQNRLDWWSALAPGATAPAPLLGAQVGPYLSSLAVKITAQGSTPTAVELTTTVDVRGGRAPGRYAMDVLCTISGSTLTIADWGMSAA